MKKSKLTAKQKKFCKEYLIDLNATKSAIRAGYSVETANRIGNQNLSKLDIQEEIQRLQGHIEKKYDLRLENVLKDIESIKSKAIEIEDLNAGLKALDMQMKHLGAYTQKVEVSGDKDAPIKVECGLSPLVMQIIEGAKVHREMEKAENKDV